jgi:hypothetical protein
MCLLGFFLRAYSYAINRSLWFDEAMLGLNIVNRSFHDLLRPLDQGAPLGFLILQKAIANSLGGRDYMLRLFPFLAGVASVRLMYIVSKQYGKGVAPIVVLGLFAISTQPIYYSSELKQYSSDVLITLLLLLAAPRCLKNEAKWCSFATLGMVGVLAIWMSHPSVFTASGIGLAIGMTLIQHRESRRLFWLLGVGLLWTVNVTLLYYVSLRYLASNSALIDYWKGSFAPLPPWGNFGWYYSALAGILNNPTGLPITAITAGLLTLGICSLAVRRWQFAVILIAPVMLALTASALRKYPFGGRLSLFMVPVVLLVVAEGVERSRMLLVKVSRPGAVLAASGLCIYLMHSPGLAAYNNLRSPFRGEDIKAVMSYLRQNRLNGDLIYVLWS